MMNIIQNLKIIKQIGYKKIAIFLVTMPCLFLISCAVKNHKQKQIEIYQSLQDTSIFCNNLLQNQGKLKFVKQHFFGAKNINLVDYINIHAQKNFINIQSISTLSTKVFENIKKEKIKISGLCWHDYSIFKFIDSLYEYYPGFVRILQLDIIKISEFSEQHPAIKMEIVCELFGGK